MDPIAVAATVQQALVGGPSEEEILGGWVHPIDTDMDFVRSGIYRWYHAIGEALRPSSILEIGVRFGYSLRSLTLGSKEVQTIRGYDMELDHVGSSAYVLQRFKDEFPEVDIAIANVDTRNVRSLACTGLFDLAHVDGDHSEEGCYHDCILACRYVRSGGYLLIDDVASGGGDPRARRGALRFLEERQIEAVILDTYRGLYIAQIP